MVLAMEKSDYLKDQIDQFGKVLASMIEKMIAGKSSESIQIETIELEKSFADLFGIAIRDVDNISKSPTRVPHEILFKLAVFYYQKALNATIDARSEPLMKALKLAETAQSSAPGYSLTYQEQIANIKVKISALKNE